MKYRWLPAFVCVSLLLVLLAAAAEPLTQEARETIVLREDVHIRELVQWRDADYEIHANVIFHEGGELVVENATVSLMCTYTREFRFQWEGGTLITRNVTIGGAQQGDKVYQTYFEIQHGAWESHDTIIRYSSGVTMGWTGHRVKFHATRLMAGPHPDSIILSSNAADVLLKDSEFNISLAVSAERGGQGRLDLPANEPVNRVFDSSNVPGIKYRLELVNTKVDLWWVFFSGIRQGGPATQVVLGHCPRLIPSIIAYDLQASLELPAPWPTRQGDATELHIGNLSLQTTGQPVGTWCWGLYLDGAKTDVTLRGPTCICELFLSAGKMVLAGDPGTFNALNACTTVEVGHRHASIIKHDETGPADTPREPAELVMRNATLGRFAPGDAIVGQLTAHAGGRILVEHARCANLKLITKSDGTIKLSDVQLAGELERIENGGEISWTVSQ